MKVRGQKKIYEIWEEEGKREKTNIPNVGQNCALTQWLSLLDAYTQEIFITKKRPCAKEVTIICQRL